MGKPLFILLVIAGAWYGWNEFGRVDGAYSDNGEPLALLFTTGQCGEACDSMRRHLKTRVEFVEHDAFEDEEGRELYKQYGGDGYLPYVVFGNQRVVGPDSGALVSALAAELGPDGVKKREAQALSRHFDAAGEPRVVMYVTEWCGYCRKAREYFVANNIEFAEYDIEKDRKAKRDYDVLRGSGTPLVYQGYTRVVGFNRRQIEKTFDL